MDIGSHLHMTFACGKSSLPNAYGQKLNTNIMVLDLIAPKNKVWVDGGVTIPDTGCENFEKSRLAENEVMLHVQQYS